MKPTLAKTFTLYPTDLAVIKRLAEQIKRDQGGKDKDSAALRIIIREWAAQKAQAILEADQRQAQAAAVVD